MTVQIPALSYLNEFYAKNLLNTRTRQSYNKFVAWVEDQGGEFISTVHEPSYLRFKNDRDATLFLLKWNAS